MSPSRKSAGPRGSRSSHATRRHGSATPPAVPPAPPPLAEVARASECGPRAPDARPFVHHIIALEAIGWRVVELRPSIAGDAPALWRVTIERTDENASMTATEVDLDVALAELVRYTRVDAP